MGACWGFASMAIRRACPCVFLHGTPGSRLQIAFAHEVCRGPRRRTGRAGPLGLWAERGAARCRAQPYADDIAALMDHLGHARFCIGGVSGGAPYAAAVAACLASRVLAVAFVSPVGPIADAGLGPALSLAHRFNFTVAAPLPARCRHGLPRLSIGACGARRDWRHACVTLRAARIDKRADCPARDLRAHSRQFPRRLAAGHGRTADRSVDLLASLGDRPCSHLRTGARVDRRRGPRRSDRSRPRAGRSEFPIASSPSCRRKGTCGWSLTTPTCRSGCTPLHAPAPVRRIDRRNAKGASPCQRLDNT